MSNYFSKFTVSLLIFNFMFSRKGFAEFHSDNVSTISIIKDFISKEATSKNIKIDISTGRKLTFL